MLHNNYGNTIGTTFVYLFLNSNLSRYSIKNLIISPHYGMAQNKVNITFLIVIKYVLISKFGFAFGVRYNKY